MNKLLPSLFAFFLFSSALSAETGYIQIKAPPGIMIFLDGNLKGKTTAEQGGLILQDVPAGSREIKALKAGSNPKIYRINVKAGDIAVWDAGAFAPKIMVEEKTLIFKGIFLGMTGNNCRELLRSYPDIDLQKVRIVQDGSGRVVELFLPKDVLNVLFESNSMPRREFLSTFAQSFNVPLKHFREEIEDPYGDGVIGIYEYYKHRSDSGYEISFYEGFTPSVDLDRHFDNDPLMRLAFPGPLSSDSREGGMTLKSIRSKKERISAFSPFTPQKNLDRMEEERKRKEEERRLAMIQQEEERRRKEEEKRLAMIRAEEERLAIIRMEEAILSGKSEIKSKIIRNAVYSEKMPDKFTGWAKELHATGQIWILAHYKQGRRDGLSFVFYENGQPKAKGYYEEGELQVDTWIEYEKVPLKTLTIPTRSEK